MVVIRIFLLQRFKPTISEIPKLCFCLRDTQNKNCAFVSEQPKTKIVLLSQRYQKYAFKLSQRYQQHQSIRLTTSMPYFYSILTTEANFNNFVAQWAIKTKVTMNSYGSLVELLLFVNAFLSPLLPEDNLNKCCLDLSHI